MRKFSKLARSHIHKFLSMLVFCKYTIVYSAITISNKRVLHWLYTLCMQMYFEIWKYISYMYMIFFVGTFGGLVPPPPPLHSKKLATLLVLPRRCRICHELATYHPKSIRGSYSLNKKEWICSLFKEWILEKSEIRVILEWTFVLFTHLEWPQGSLRDSEWSLRSLQMSE